MRKHQQEGRFACAVSGVSDGGKPAPAFGVTYFEVSHQTASGGGRHVGYVRTGQESIKTTSQEMVQRRLDGISGWLAAVMMEQSCSRTWSSCGENCFEPRTRLFTIQCMVSMGRATLLAQRLANQGSALW